MTELQKMGAAAQKAAAVLRTAGEKKRTALNAAAAALRARQAEILAANEEDLKAAKENGTKRSVFLRNLLTTYFSVRVICGQNPPWDEFTPKTSPERLFIVDKADEKFTMVRLMSGIYLFKIKDEEIWGGDDNLKYIPVRWQNKIIGFMVKV